MPERWNALQWDGEPGHYEVYYLTFTDPATGVGFWIRYTMVAPLPETGEEATCSLWFMAMDPADPAANVGREGQLPDLAAAARRASPFELRIGDAVLTDTRDDGRARAGRAPLRVGPALAAARCRPTATCTRSCARREDRQDDPVPAASRRRGARHRRRSDGRRIDVAGARGGQAHLWGSKHATRWAWVHCNDFTGADGGRARHVHRRRERVRAALRPRARAQHAGGRARRRART